MLRFLSLIFLTPLNSWLMITFSSGRDVDQISQALVQFTCQGALDTTCDCDPPVPETSAQSKIPGGASVRTLKCVNSRFTGTDIFPKIRQFPELSDVRLYGNNFVELPKNFCEHNVVKDLNLTKNNIIYVNQDSFNQLRALNSLDMSNNKLQFRDRSHDHYFLAPLKFLRRLVLRHAFATAPADVNNQTVLLEAGLKYAELESLEFLDLSHNELERFPPKLICYTPELTHLMLSNNRLRTLHLDTSCKQGKLKLVDLRWNRLTHFDHHFVHTANILQPVSTQVFGNPFDCNLAKCTSWHSVKWFTTTEIIQDKDSIRCRMPGRKDGDFEFGQLMNEVYPTENPKCAQQSLSTKPTEPAPIVVTDKIKAYESSEKEEEGAVDSKPTTDEEKEQEKVEDIFSAVDAFNETLLNSSAIALRPMGFGKVFLGDLQSGHGVEHMWWQRIWFCIDSILMQVMEVLCAFGITNRILLRA